MGLAAGGDGPGARLAADGTPGDPPIDLGRVGEAARRNGAMVVIAAAAVAGIVLFISLRAPERFSATARIAGDGAAVGTAGPSDVATGLATSRELVTAPAVLDGAARDVPGETAAALSAAVSARVNPDSNILDVTAISGDPAKAARIANAVAASFLERRTGDRRTAARLARKRLSAQLRGVRNTTAPGTLATALRERISDLALQEATAGSDLRFAEAAAPPERPFAPRPVRSAALAGLATLLIALTASVVRDRTRRRGAQAEELAARAGVPLLAVLPVRSRLWRPLRRLTLRPGKQDERLVVEQAALQASVRLALPPRTQRTVLVCDVAGRGGAGQVAEGLARSLSWARLDAALVRADRSADLDAALGRARTDRPRYVIVQGPAVTGSSLLPVLACHASAAIVVGRLGRTSSGQVTTALQLLDALDVHTLGLVLTASPADAAALRGHAFDAAAPPPRRTRQTPRGDAAEASAWPTESVA